MNYLTVENLSKTYGEKLLFENLSFGLEAGQKMALIARNGSGKTSLLNIIAGKDIPDNGKVTLRNDIKVAYLTQNTPMDEQQQVLEVLFNTDNEFIRTIRQYNTCLDRLNKENNPATQQELEKAMAKMDAFEAWDYESRVKEILSRMNITNLGQPVAELSGGQRKRVALARCLIEEADLLIMDEPTNHLDTQMIEWLEEYLSKQKRSLFLVTHDRYFLDRVCNEIVEISDHQLYHYNGNYSYFLRKKAEREQQQMREISKAKSVYRTELEWMRRMPQARATKAKARIDAFYELEGVAKKKIETDDSTFRMQMQRMGKKILEINNISKRFDQLQLLSDFSYTFKKGDRIGLVGPNGVGKSTFLNLITGKLAPDSGQISTGETIHYGYYSQEGLQFSDEKRVIDIVKEVAETVDIGGSTISASQFLLHFGFPQTTQYNYFSNLSGGERRKLYLLLTLIQNPNFLILDEPTNDLDLYTLNKLEDFLKEYPGCLMIVSHDRYFMDKLVEHVFAFEGQGKVRQFPGNYTQYHDKKQAELQAEKKQRKTDKPVKEKPKKAPSKKKPTYKEQKEFEQLELDMEQLETEKADLLEKMNQGDNESMSLQQMAERFGEVERLLEEKGDRWLELSEKME